MFQHSDESGAESDGDDRCESDSPLWKLLETVKSQLGANG